MRTRTRGFTLIELMVVMSIVAVLASVAIPEFSRVQLRSKQGERAVLMQSIHNAVEDYYMREAHFPALVDPANPGAGSTLNLSGNPSWANPGTAKRPWRFTSWGDDWQSLTLTVEGGVYYRYWGTGNEAGQQHQYWLIGDGDLDGDGVLDQMQRYYAYQATQLQHFAGSPSGCTWEWRFPGNDLTF
jgi:prepilin-type N-terminal cleavage/methylation domain-containing protein